MSPFLACSILLNLAQSCSILLNHASNPYFCLVFPSSTSKCSISIYLPFGFFECVQPPLQCHENTWKNPLKIPIGPSKRQDVPMIDQTFGFDTACTEATKAVNSAYVEAKGNATGAANGIIAGWSWKHRTRSNKIKQYNTIYIYDYIYLCVCVWMTSILSCIPINAPRNKQPT